MNTPKRYFFLGTSIFLLLLLNIQASCPNPQTHYYPVRGIDISHHQGYINWYSVKQDGLDFVFMKATEGQTFKDKRFKQNWAGAKKAGLRRGAYHYFTFCRTGKEQALNFINTVSLGANDLPPVIDLEFGGYCSNTRPKASVVVRELRTMIETFIKHYNKRPIIYCTYNCYNLYVKGIFDECLIWIRDTRNHRPQLHKQWAFWQYCDQGRISGIQGNVDLNVFYGTNQQFARF